MLKVLIVDDNQNFDISLINYIREKKLDFVRFEGIATNGIDAYNKIKQLKPSVVILDFNLPDMNGISVIQKLINDGEKLPIVLLMTGYPHLLNSIQFTNLIYGCLFKPFELSIITDYLKKIHTQFNETKLSKRISNILDQFDFNCNSIGYSYLVESIMICLNLPSCTENLEKNVYPLIAKKYGITNYKKIKWNIEKTINSMVRYTSQNILKKYFRDESKPSVKIFIKTIVNIIEEQQNDNY